MGRGKYRVYLLCHLDWNLLGLMYFIYLDFPGGLLFNFFLILLFMAYYEAITIFYWHSHLDTWVTHAKIHLFMEYIYFKIKMHHIKLKMWGKDQ